MELRSHKSYAVHNLSHKNAKMLTAPVVAWVELTEKYQEALQVHSKYPKSPSYLTSWRACSDEQEDRSVDADEELEQDGTSANSRGAMKAMKAGSSAFQAVLQEIVAAGHPGKTTDRRHIGDHRRYIPALPTVLICNHGFTEFTVHLNEE